MRINIMLLLTDDRAKETEAEDRPTKLSHKPYIGGHDLKSSHPPPTGRKQKQRIGLLNSPTNPILGAGIQHRILTSTL